MDFTRKYVSIILMLGSLSMLFSSVVVFGTSEAGDKSPRLILPLPLKTKEDEKVEQRRKAKLELELELKKKKVLRHKKIITELLELKQKKGEELVLKGLKAALEKINEKDGVVNQEVIVEVFNNEEIQVILTEMGRDSRVPFLTRVASAANDEKKLRLADIIHGYIAEIQKEDGLDCTNFGEVEQQVKKIYLSHLYRRLKKKVDPDVRLTSQSIKSVFEEKRFASDCEKAVKLHWGNHRDKLLEDLEKYSESMNNSMLANIISMHRDSNKQSNWF